MATTVENSQVFGVLNITIPNPAASVQCGTAGTTDSAGQAALFSSKPIRSCLIQLVTGSNGYVDFHGAASANSWKLSSDYALPVPIDNLNKLYFYGDTGAVIQILWRN
ncbi:MAG TPA: hypothetical protein PLV55_06095 [Anaerohalosphaeraceae bacterium]|nr:hypothetical protein [Anaerohalosphaeraceae bacterium]